MALEAKTGKVRWSFQVVHHDLWDFDVGSQPSLITVPRDGREIPAVAVATKMGHLFILDRATGVPLPSRRTPGSCQRRPRGAGVADPAIPGPAQAALPTPIHPPTTWGVTPGERKACLAEFDRCEAAHSSRRPVSRAR